MSVNQQSRRIAAVAALTLVLASCAVDATGTPVPSTPTGTPAPTQTPPEPTTPAPAYQTITVDEIGLSFEVPAGWQRLESGWAWTSPGQSQPRPSVGVNWVDLPPPQEVEAVLLPGPSQITGSEAVEVSWASGRSFTLAVYAASEGGEGEQAPIASHETHVLFVLTPEEGRLGIEFYAAAETAEQLSNLQTVLQHMLESSRLD
jgi:hypothetical protein